MNMSYCSLDASIRETKEKNSWNCKLDRTETFKYVSEKPARFVDQVKTHYSFLSVFFSREFKSIVSWLNLRSKTEDR